MVVLFAENCAHAGTRKNLQRLLEQHYNYTNIFRPFYVKSVVLLCLCYCCWFLCLYDMVLMANVVSSRLALAW